MTNNTTTEITEDAEFELNAASGEEKAPVKTGSTGLIALIVLLVLLLGGGAVYWLYDKQKSIRNLMDQQLQHYDSKLDELTIQVQESTSNVSNIESSRQASTSEFENRLTELTNNQIVLSDTLEVVQNKKPRQETDWVLEEVEYLLTIAQQRLSLERDAATALAAMQSADNRLKDLGNPNLNGVREQLIREMNALREVKDADISGMVLYLADVTTRVESLPLKDFEVPTLMDMQVPTKEEAVEGNWKEMFLSMWGDLVKLVEVKDQAVPDEILFDPELRYFLQQNLQLELTSAKLSVLRRDSNSMKASLNRVAEILKRYFDGDAAPVKAILDQLAGMETMDLKPPMPEITQALNELKAYKKALDQEEASS